MGIEIKIREIIIEVEYLLVIVLCISGISDNALKFLDKYYICMLFIIFHELSHILIGSMLNKRLARVFIGISGMTAFFKYNLKNKNRLYYIKEIIIYIAGPLSNILIAYFFKDIKFVFEINIFLSLLNLLPIYPLDGYNILKNLLYSLNIGNKRLINKILKSTSIIFLLIISIGCTLVFYKFSNMFCIIFIIYILLLNLKINR